MNEKIVDFQHRGGIVGRRVDGGTLTNPMFAYQLLDDDGGSAPLQAEKRTGSTRDTGCRKRMRSKTMSRLLSLAGGELRARKIDGPDTVCS